MTGPADGQGRRFQRPRSERRYRDPVRDMREEIARMFLGRSWHKVSLGEFHIAELVRLEDAHQLEDFYRLNEQPFVPAEAHADGAVLQLTAAFDAFACGVAHWHGLLDADRASFAGDRWNARLAEAAGGELGDLIRATPKEKPFEDLAWYRNLAAHRGMLGERPLPVDEGGATRVRLTLSPWLPDDVPDPPTTDHAVRPVAVRDILRRSALWVRPRILALTATASAAWDGAPPPAR